MKISLRAKLITAFLGVVVITGGIAAWVGVHLIGVGIVREAQKKVETDLNSACEMYQRKSNDICTLVRLTALRFFIKESLISGDIRKLSEGLELVRENEGIDILTLTDDKGKVVVRSRNPQLVGDDESKDELVSKVLTEQKIVVATCIVKCEELIKEGKDLADRAYMKFIPTIFAKPTEKESRYNRDGMMIKAVAPVMDGNKLLGVLYGGTLLNRNYELVDKIKDIVCGGEKYKGRDIGTATIFQGDFRISTNVMTEQGERAIGTRVSEKVQGQVLEKGKPWFDRAFVVNDWYLTAYKPIRGSENEIIGMLYVGILEAKFVDLRRRNFLIFSGITITGVLLSICIAYFLANRITKPIKYLVSGSKQIAEGNLEVRVNCNSGDEIGELGRAFNSMAGSLKERDKRIREYAEREMARSERLATLGQIAAGVAHEINNPLAVISGRAEFLASKIGDAEPLILKSIKTIEQEAEKAGSTIHKFLSFARLPEPKLELVDINKLLEESVTLASHQALIEKITVIKELNTEIPRVLLDPQQIQQVFINVMLNAFQSMSGGGKLFITTGVRDGYVETKFADTGCGIGKEHISQVFTPFFTTKKSGTGLGLAICKNIVDKHNGSIQAESELNKGTTVTVRLKIK